MQLATAWESLVITSSWLEVIWLIKKTQPNKNSHRTSEIRFSDNQLYVSTSKPHLLCLGTIFFVPFYYLHINIAHSIYLIYVRKYCRHYFGIWNWYLEASFICSTAVSFMTYIKNTVATIYFHMLRWFVFNLLYFQWGTFKRRRCLAPHA